MSISMVDQKKAKVIKANYELQAKVGAGPLDERVVQECEKIIEENDVDFGPLAQEFLDKLKVAIGKARKKEVSTQEAVKLMAQPVMELKANAAIFRYNLIGNLATVMLSFLESLKEMDDNAIEIVDAHHKTLTLIAHQKMSGDGGEHGKVLEKELKDACLRYMKRKS